MSVSKTLSQINANIVDTQSRPATVSALRADGKVNLTYQGSVILGAVCLETYQNRAIGDRVHVIQSDNVWIVQGKFGPDAAYVGPAVAANYYYNYTTTGVFVTSTAHNPPQQGCLGTDQDPQNLVAAWSYWNGSSNSLGGLVGVVPVRMWFARLDNDGGHDDSVVINLLPHGYDVLPGNGFTYYTTYSQVSFSLQKGQVVVVPLPSDWLSDIEAGTIRGVCAVPNTGSDPTDSYCQFAAISGNYTSP